MTTTENPRTENVPLDSVGSNGANPEPEMQITEMEAQFPGRDLRFPNQPAQEDLFVSRGGSTFNAIKEFVSGSVRPEEYLPRTNVDDNEVMDFCDLWSENHLMTLGYIDLPQELWMNLTLRRSIKQGALTMGKEMFIGERARNFAMRAGMMQRANTINKEQFTPGS